MLKFVDFASVSELEETEAGNLRGIAKIARTGIQLYRADEVGLTGDKMIRVYRSPDEVFSLDSLETYSSKPITDDHPAEGVTPDNFAGQVRGTVSKVAKDGEWVVAALAIQDRALINKVKAGKHEVSVGYTAMLDHTPGKTPDGQEYDAAQKDIRVNHLAVVQRGRANQQVSDAAVTWGASPFTTINDKKEILMSNDQTTVVIGDQAISVSAQDAAKIEKIKDAHVKALADQKADHVAEVSKKDKELADKDIEIEKLKKEVKTADQLDAMVESRATLVADAAKIAPEVKAKGVADADLRKSVVKAKLGDAATDGKSDAYIEARFDALLDAVADAKPDQVRTALSQAKPIKDYADDEAAAHAAYLADFNSAKEEVK